MKVPRAPRRCSRPRRRWCFSIPKPIREHILPLIVETMIQGGEIDPAARLLDQRKNDPRLAYARALLQQAEGDTEQALSMLDALAERARPVRSGARGDPRGRTAVGRRACWTKPRPRMPWTSCSTPGAAMRGNWRCANG